MIKSKNFKRIPQIEISDKYMYCTKRIQGDEIINWDKNSRDLFNFIRASYRSMLKLLQKFPN